VDPDRDSTVTGLEWHGEFDPESRSSRTIRDDRYACVVRYDNVAADGRPLGNERASEPAAVELYDLEADPWQRNDLADEPAFAEERGRLLEKLHEVHRATGDPRFTGEMGLFRRTRQFVQDRKEAGYPKTKPSLELWRETAPGSE